MLYRSLIYSLLIHTVLAVLLFYSYKTLSAYIHEQQHNCACCHTTINLNSIVATKKQLSAKVEEHTEKVEKKVVKKVLKKEVPRVLENEIVEKKQTQENLKEEIVKDTTKVVKPVESTEKEIADTHCVSEVIVEEKPTEPLHNKEEEYVELHIQEIVALLKENLYYPRRARRKGIEGVVTIKFTLSKEAKVSNIEIVKSDYEILSRAAVETVENLAEKLPKPDDELTLTIPISYSLR